MKKLYTSILLVLAILMIGGCGKLNPESLVLSEMTQSENDKIKELIEGYNTETNSNDIVYYDNKLDISNFTDIAFSIEDYYIDFTIGGNIDSILTNCEEFISPVIDKSEITNNDVITIDYVTDNNNDYNRFAITSYSINKEDEVSFQNRKIDAFTVYYDEQVSIFDKLVNKNINDFIEIIGNPTYKSTTVVTDPYITDEKQIEKYVYTYVYECDKFKIILFSYDDETIDRISVEIL